MSTTKYIVEFFAKTNPGIAKEDAVWTPGVTRQGEPTKAV